MDHVLVALDIVGLLLLLLDVVELAVRVDDVVGARLQRGRVRVVGRVVVDVRLLVDERERREGRGLGDLGV